jgi:homoserine O-succinyltransferase/O-acetyltransferase
MPLIIGQLPARWAREKGPRPVSSAKSPAAGVDHIEIALINNMPDAALEDTESQFFELLDAASGNLPVTVKLFSLPELGRSELAKRRLASVYFSTEDLLNWPFDAVIITGTEPRQADLRKEAYWPSLTKILDWAERNTISTVLSCLAAHAGVLHSDGIERRALGEKQCGVFTYKKATSHMLTSHTSDETRTPHSRWNEVRPDALASCGYTVLTHSPEAGVDLFVKRKKRSLFVYFQGHPEYGTRTLLREYQRDIKRFLRRERDSYPSIPNGYFDSGATRVLSDFQEKAMKYRRGEVIESFPEGVVARMVQNTWQSAATDLYSRWLRHVASKKAEYRGSRVGMGLSRSVAAGISNASD